MKQKQLSILAASLVAAFAANVASAGQIQSSSSAIAHETIVNDAQAVSAPPVSYRFFGDIDASLVTQTFQVQLVLPNGTFKTPGNAAAITMVDKNGVVIPSALYTVSTPTLSTDGKTLFANITVPQAAGSTFVTPAVRFNDTVTNIGAQAATVSGLYTLVGAVAPCVNTTPTLGVTVREYANVTSTAQATDTLNPNPANEHTRSGSTNDGTLFTFPTNISVKLAAATTNLARVDASSQNTQFRPSGVTVSPTTDGYFNSLVANLGTIKLNQDATGTDSGSNAVYALVPTGTPPSAGLGYSATAATNTTGAVEAKNLTVSIVASQGFALGSTVALSTTPGGAAIPGLTATVTATTGNTVTLSAAGVPATILTAPMYVVYTVPGNTTIPSSTFTATGTLVKAADSGTTYLNEQNNSCNASLASLTGGVKVDVRNYASTKQTGGWMSVIRVINPEEQNTATLYGQLIRADGSYGNWGVIGTLKPRAAINLTNAQIEAQLTSAPVNNGTGFVGVAGGAVAQDIGDRLRISADGVSALKVQNYLYNATTKNFIEASGSQGVDFDSSLDRAPGNAQLNDQDAQRGIAK